MQRVEMLVCVCVYMAIPQYPWGMDSKTLCGYQSPQKLKFLL